MVSIVADMEEPAKGGIDRQLYQYVKQLDKDGTPFEDTESKHDGASYFNEL